MKKVVCLFLFVLSVTVFSPVPVFSQTVLEPLKTDNPPEIDGILDDPIWRQTTTVTGFKTWTPDFGKEPGDQTVVYLAYDSENMYFGFRCYDSQPDKIKASVTHRDNIRPDDWIALNIDSFYDQQSGYAFYVNPLGIQGDTRFTSTSEDAQFDAVWYSKGRIDDEGYTIEIKIPFKSIRIAKKNPVEMGIIFERNINRLSEGSTYPELSADQNVAWLTQTAKMVFHDIAHYTLFELLPAFTNGQKSNHVDGVMTSEDPQRDISLTAKYGITSDLILDGTYNPDFSQVEADAGQVDVNLRYALFFPEKRPFFLEGRDNFLFGGTGHGDPFHSVVHTRMIANPVAGIKLNGKLSRKNTIASLFAVDELPGTAAEKEVTGDYANFSIIRYKRTLSESSYIGGFYTGRDLKNSYNRVGGLDGQIQLGPYSVFGFHGFCSFTKGAEQDERDNSHTVGLTYLHFSRDWGVDLGFHDIGEDFQTETGYITRTGITKIRGSVTPKFYPEKGIIRRVAPTFYLSYAKDKPSDKNEETALFYLSLRLLRNSSITIMADYSTEIFLAEKFKTGGINFGGRSQITKEFSFSLSYRNEKKIYYSESPYQGKGSTTSGSIIYQPSDKINSSLNLTHTDFYRDSDSEKIYDYTIIRERITYQMNRYLFFRGIAEYNSYRKKLLTDFLASFTYIPGTVLHVGYGSVYEKLRWDNTIDPAGYVASDNFLETTRGFFFKASYLWRM